ncbi:hypothetical protein GGS21DRAFT_232296 [Xylaria nigripes]|nr:hypothetical protein GGS21DRAFT_232296 [Xylaria nigripes]
MCADSSVKIANIDSFLYVLAAILLPFVVVVAESHSCFTLALEHAPILIAFMLCIIEDCSRSHLAATSQWWTETMSRENLTSRTNLTHERALSSHDSMRSDYQVDDALLLRYIWSPKQSCLPSSRASDISLSSSIPESLPSSWGSSTRMWFPEFSANGHPAPGELGGIEYQRAQTY